MRRIFSIVILALILSGCGYDGHYRYPCQDPANWGAEECNPPICEATGTCTKDLVKTDTDIVVEEEPEAEEKPITKTSSPTQPKENVDSVNTLVDEITEGNTND